MLHRDLVKLANLVLRRALSSSSKPAPLTNAYLFSTPLNHNFAQPRTAFSTSLALGRSKFRHSRRHIPVLFELWRRREEVGPEKPKHRSEFPNWNYDAELFGFSKRLNEEWKRETLIEAFTEKAYAEAEGERRAKLATKTLTETEQASNLPVLKKDSPVLCNADLSVQGENLSRAYITAFLRHSLPAYPDEGVKAACDFLVSDDLLGYVCKNMGTADLILSTEYPVTVKVFANVLKALIGGLARDQGAKHAYLFVHDFVLTQLSGRDINQFWNITNPMGLLAQIMKKSVEKGEPEPRIIWQTGISTPLAAYKIGIYDSKSKVLLGQGGGETSLIAEQMAALDALYRIFGTSDWSVPFQFGREARKTGLTETVIAKADTQKQS